MSVMMPILMTSPEIWAWAGEVPASSVAAAIAQAVESRLNFIDVSWMEG